jgi:hypothetical protein
MRVLYERCAAVDLGKDVIAVAVRMPGDSPDGRVTVKREYKTFYGVVREMALWLVSLGVTHVTMESTGCYSMPVYHALLEHGTSRRSWCATPEHCGSGAWTVFSAPAGSGPRRVGRRGNDRGGIADSVDAHPIRGVNERGAAVDSRCPRGGVAIARVLGGGDGMASVTAEPVAASREPDVCLVPSGTRWG